MKPSIFTVRPGVKTLCDLHGGICELLLSPLNVPKLARHCFPIRTGTQALQDVDFVSVRADQDSWLATFHSAQNPCRCRLRGSPEKPLESGNLFLTCGSCNAGSNARTAGNRCAPSAWMQAGNA